MAKRQMLDEEEVFDQDDVALEIDVERERTVNEILRPRGQSPKRGRSRVVTPHEMTDGEISIHESDDPEDDQVPLEPQRKGRIIPCSERIFWGPTSESVQTADEKEQDELMHERRRLAS